MKIRTILFSLLIVLFIASCSGPAAVTTTQKSTPAAAAQVTIPTPKTGTAVVTGKLINKADSKPFANQLVRLGKIYGEGTQSIYVYNESADPGAYTQADGTFVISDVNPASYAVIMVDNSGNYAAIKENAEKVLTVDVAADKVVKMGDIQVDLSPAPPVKK